MATVPSPIELAPDAPSDLDAAGVRNAAAAAFADADAAAGELERALLPLLGGDEDRWRRARDPLRRDRSITAHGAGDELAGLLDQIGNLALLRLNDGCFLLLHARRGRWFFLDADGAAVAEYPTFPAGTDASAVAEALLFSIPAQPRQPLGAFDALRRILKPAWAEVGLASLIVNAGMLALPLFAMLVYDKVVNNAAFSTLWALTIGMLVYLALDMALRAIRTWATERLVRDFVRRDDATIWNALRGQTEPPRGGYARLLAHYRELAATREFVSSTFLLGIADAPFLLLYLFAITVVAWPLVFVVIAIGLVYAAFGLRHQRTQQQLAREAEQAQIAKLGFLGESLAALDLLRLAPGATWFDRRWHRLTHGVAELDARRRINTNLSGTVTLALSTLTTVAMLVVGAYLIDARMLTVGGLIAANILAGRAMAILASVFQAQIRVGDFRRAVGRLEESMDATAPRTEAPLARPEIDGRIQLIGIAKHYPQRPPVLTDVSLAIGPGERIALLGRPGAGKTTLLRCLARFVRLDAGQILIDGVDLADIDRDDMRRWLAYKAQEPALFAGTLDDNLRVALPAGNGAADARRRFDRALWAAGLEDEFASGRMSLGMAIEEQGRNLSGGQRQKVALARALAQESRILLLDEPSLGLDPDSEKLFADRLPRVMRDEDILVMVSHSAAMLGVARRVIALEGGRVVADGERTKLVRVA